MEIIAVADNTTDNDKIDKIRMLESKLLELQASNAELQALEKRWATVIDTISQGIQENDVDGTITFSNRAHHRILGYANGELIGRSIASVVVDQNEKAYLPKLLKELVANQPAPEPYFSQNYTKDGRIIDVRVDWNYQRDDKGRVVGFTSVIADVTDQMNMKNQLSEQVAFLQTLIDTLPHPIFYKDARGRYMGCNQAFEAYIGISKNQLIGKTVFDLAPKDLADIYHEADCALFASQDHQIYEADVRFADGTLRSVIFNKAVFFRKDGSIGGLVGAMVDITEIKRTEAERQLLAKAIEQSPEIVIITDLEGRIHYVNAAFERISGYRRSDAIGKTPAIVKSDVHDAQHYQGLWNTLRAGKQWSGRMTNRRKDGSLFEVEATIVPVQRTNGQVTDYLSVERDISRELLRDKQIQQAQKMEAIGTLAAGIAHDFNNILAAIVGYTDIALLGMSADSPNRAHLKKVLKAGDRAKSLVNQILAFSRSQEKEARPVVVQIILKEVTKMLKATLPSTISIHSDLHSNAAILADPTQIHQVIMNLCTNAAHAMREKGGKLTVILEPHTINGEHTGDGEVLAAGEYVKLVVRDTGEGIPAAFLERIFDPFYTTKKPGEGTGMGLAVVHGIVAECGGAIVVHSEPGQGTTFEILLPVIDEEPDTDLSDDLTLPVGNERVLFVDDEPNIVEISVQMLESLGYEATGLMDSTEALARFARSPEAYDLVMTDMTMPTMTGEVLGQKILSLRPDIPIIICTGYSEKLTEASIRSLGFTGIAYKPLIMKELATIVRQSLDREPNDNN
jgi:PAS domain S-box-containing protein